MSPVGDLIESFNVSCHQFLDDTQLFVAVEHINDATPTLERLANCSAAVRSWFLRNDLQLNADKSEVVILAQQLSSDWLPLSKQLRSPAERCRLHPY